MPFDKILGQTRPLTILRRMLDAGRIPHACMFTGIAGIGKYTTAKAFAKALNCSEHSSDFCDTCTPCKKINSDIHPDITVIEPEKNIIKIDQIRRLQQSIAFSPLEANWRIVIIDQAESMNKEAANCLLKTLEEPPPATVLILTVNSTSKILPTILSRCQKIAFIPLTKNDMQAVLAQEGIPSDQALAVIPHAHGSLYRARMLLDATLIEDFTKLTTALLNSSTVEQRLELAGTLSKSNDRVSSLLILLLEWLRDVVLLRHGAETEHLFNAQQPDSLMLAARQIGPILLNKKIDQVSRLLLAQNQNINMQLGFEALLLS